MPARFATVGPGWLTHLQLLPRAVLLTLGGVLLASVASLLLSEFTVRRADQDADRIAGVLRRMEATADLKVLLLDAETGQRGFLLTGEARNLEPLQAAMKNLAKTTARLRLLSNSPELGALIDEINANATERLSAADASIALAQNGHGDQAIDLLRARNSTELMDRIRAEIAELDRRSGLELADLQGRQVTTVFWTRLVTALSTVLIIGLLFAVSRLSTRQAVQERQFKQAAEREAQRMNELVATRTVELSELSSHMQRVVEREKAELARNLHDELGGLLTAAKMDLSWVQGATSTMDPEIARKLQLLSQGLSEAMDVKRRVVESLRPALLDHFGLSVAMQNYFEETCRHAGLNCRIVVPDDLPELPQDLAIGLFRVGQESLTNIIRHAKARNVRMTITRADDNIELEIVDDGCGVDLLGRKFRASHGISGMRHRVEALGGNFVLESAPGRGTRVKITVPRTRPATAQAIADAAP